MLDLILSHSDEVDFQPLVCCTYELGVIGERMINRGITVYHSIASNRWDLKIIYRLVNIIKREHVDIIYDLMSDNNTMFYGLLASKIAGGRLFINAFHNAREYNLPIRLLRRICMKFSSRVIVLSPSHKDFVERLYGVKAKKIRVVPNSVDLDRFPLKTSSSRYRNSWGLSPNVPIVAIIASLRPLKAHRVFLRAAKRIIDQVPDSHFLIVGDGPERGDLEEYTLHLGIGSNTRYLGERTDIPEILSSIDVVVLTSDFETFPIAILEAMAAFKPVVSTNVGYVNEIIEHGTTGLLVPPGDDKELADAVIKIITDPVLAKKFGETGRNRIEKNFSSEQTRNAISSVILEVINKNLEDEVTG